MDKNFLNEFGVDDTFRAFTVSLCRMIIEDPRLLLELSDISGISGYKDLFEQLQNENELKHFSKTVYEDSKNYNWSFIEEIYRSWGKYGWITDYTIVPFSFWNSNPESQVDADKLVLQFFDKKSFIDLKDELAEITNNKQIYKEAIISFNNKCYAACASLLIALIDGELIRCKSSLLNGNKKTGLKAGERLMVNLSDIEAYRLPGLFHLELINYDSYISTLFESGNGFENEPRCLNRNYFHHGMSKRKVLRKDCIKLLIAYRQTIKFQKLLK